jgi:hypothetical protein
MVSLPWRFNAIASMPVTFAAQGAAQSFLASAMGLIGAFSSEVDTGSH